MTKKRSIILTIIFSIITPGLGHIYNGKLKKGLILYSLLIIFSFLPAFTTLFSFYGLIVGILIQISIIIFIVFDAIRISKNNKNYELKLINKWYLYLTAIIFNFLFLFYPISFISDNVLRYKGYQTSSRSNVPTLYVKEKFMVDRWYYRFNKIKRGEIVIFKNPSYNSDEDHSEKYIVKRCVALPGDKVEIKDYNLYLNDNLLKSYKVKIETAQELKNRFKSELGLYQKDLNIDEYLKEYEKDIKNYGPVVINENTFFCLGDNRTNSMDSRIWGSIASNTLFGKALYIYWSDNFSRVGSVLN